MRQRFPEAEISLIGLPWAKDMVKRLPYIDRLLPFPGYPGLPEIEYCTERIEAFLSAARAYHTKNLISWADPHTALDDTHSSWANLTALKRAGEALLEHLHSDINETLSISIGRYHSGIHGIARSYEDARAALALGRRCHGENRAYCLDSLGAAAFVGISDERTKLELALHLLSPLDHEPELLDTLQMFFSQNCSASETAAKLAIHRNTLTYRLEKIALLTGLDPRRFEEATQIYLALLLRSFSIRSC